MLKLRCMRALKRIFILCDHDRDGALSDVELNDFQVCIHLVYLAFCSSAFYCHSVIYGVD